MNEIFVLKIGVMLLIFVGSIFSWMSYRDRRKDTDQNAINLAATRQAIRNLTDAERQAMPSPLEAPGQPNEELKIQDLRVYQLDGYYVRHGIKSDNNSIWHDLIGDVEVILPYDANLHLQPINHAEVVFAGTLAVVIRLNDTFELIPAKERHEHQTQQSAAWDDGVPGVIEAPIGFKWVEALGEVPLPPVERKEVLDQYAGQAEDPANAVRLLSQREETRAESLERAGVGKGFKSAFFYLAAFTCMAFAVGAENPIIQLVMLLSGLAVFILACGFFRDNPDRRKPVMVNRVEGALLVPDNPAESNQPENQVTLGGRLACTVPAHWLNRLKQQNGQRVSVEIRAPDFTAVAISPSLSLQAEMERQPLAFWGRHVLHLIVALGLLFWIDSISPDFRRDLTWAYHDLNQTPVLAYNSAEELGRNLPAKGELVSLQVPGRCLVAEHGQSAYSAPATLDCMTLHLGSTAIETLETGIPDYVEALHAGNFLHSELLPASPFSGYRLPSRYAVTELPTLIETIETACRDPYLIPQESHPDCIQLKRLVAIYMMSAVHDWDDFVAAVKESDTAETPARAVLGQEQLQDIRKQGARLAGIMANQRAEVLAGDVRRAQAEGVHLKLPKNLFDDGLHRGGGFERWQALQTFVSLEGIRTIEVEGLVVESFRDVDNGKATVELAMRRDEDTPTTSGIRALWFVLVSLMIAIHFPMLVWKVLAKRRRVKSLLAADGAGKA